eukprot:COSAG04_NODE_415_length_14711_cov_7.685464_14_plen_97_part_00
MWFARRPINSWDRNAFISDVKYGSPSYTAQMNHVDHNMIIANVRAAADPFASSSKASSKLPLLRSTARRKALTLTMARRGTTSTTTLCSRPTDGRW